MDRAETLFLLHIADGYSFRNAISMIKSETVEVTMILAPRTVEMSFINNSGCAMHKITINTAELSRYTYNIRDDDGYLLDKYPIAFKTNDLLNTTKGIGKRDGIRLYCLKGDDKINVQPIKTSSKDPGRVCALFVNIKRHEYKQAEIDDVYSKEPNVRVQAKDFADICTQASTSKASSLEIIGGKKSVKFHGLSANNTVVSVNKFVSQVDIIDEPRPASNIDEIDNLLENLEYEDQDLNVSTGLTLNILNSDELVKVRIPSTVYKSLSKIHNVSHPGTQLKFYFSPDNPIKLETPLSTYGVYTICLRNSTS